MKIILEKILLCQTQNNPTTYSSSKLWYYYVSIRLSNWFRRGVYANHRGYATSVAWALWWWYSSSPTIWGTMTPSYIFSLNGEFIEDGRGTSTRWRVTTGDDNHTDLSYGMDNIAVFVRKMAMSFNNIIKLDSGNNERNTKGDTKEFGRIVNRLHGFL